MPTTARGLRYPASSAAPNVPQDIQNLASDVDSTMSVKARWYSVAGWTNTTYASVNNYDLGSLVINPGIGPFVAIVTVSGIFGPVSGATGNLRILSSLSGTTPVAKTPISTNDPSGERTKIIRSSAGASITVKANLEVLTGSIQAFADATHSYIDALVVSSA